MIENIIPIVIDPESRVARKTKQMITAALSKHDPDLVISNDIDNLYTNYDARSWLSREYETTFPDGMLCFHLQCGILGITALESLASGVPLILLTDSTGVHSSEDIPVSSDHYIKLRKNCSKEDFVEAVKKLNSMSNRELIAAHTKAHHSKERWKSIVDEMINKRLDDKMSARSDISEFFV